MNLNLFYAYSEYQKEIIWHIYIYTNTFFVELSLVERDLEFSNHGQLCELLAAVL